MSKTMKSIGTAFEWLISYWKVMLLIGLCGCVVSIMSGGNND